LPPVPIATFLAGSLLTLLIPVALLIALVVWYWRFSARVPQTADGSESSSAPAAGTVAPTGANPAPGAGNPTPSASSETSPPTHEV
jgi:hypothetical protein